MMAGGIEMAGEINDILMRVGVAVLAGGLVGLERSYQGRPAGFRTHTLVCMASSLLMLVTIYQEQFQDFSNGRLNMLRGI